MQFLTRPFVVGDRIELKTTSGGTVLVGIVERIDPMRTVLRTDGTVPVAVPNKAITDMIVSNESRLGRSHVVTEFKVHFLHVQHMRCCGQVVFNCFQEENLKLGSLLLSMLPRMTFLRQFFEDAPAATRWNGQGRSFLLCLAKQCHP